MHPPRRAPLDRPGRHVPRAVALDLDLRPPRIVPRSGGRPARLRPHVPETGRSAPGPVVPANLDPGPLSLLEVDGLGSSSTRPGPPYTSRITSGYRRPSTVRRPTSRLLGIVRDRSRSTTSRRPVHPPAPPTMLEVEPRRRPFRRPGLEPPAERRGTPSPHPPPDGTKYYYSVDSACNDNTW